MNHKEDVWLKFMFEDVDIENIKYYLPSIVFTYKCGTKNIAGLYELWKPSKTDCRFDKTDHWNFEKCGWLGCDCEIVNHNLVYDVDDGRVNPLWKIRFGVNHDGEFKNNRGNPDAIHD
tara:strand:- start:44 stop:397 length:354 start_codon:yes stop_codon:yes gene_type:complete